MLSVSTNFAANLARMHSNYAETKQQVSMTRLSSGSRVNSAADDAAGMAVSSKMKSQIKGLNSVLKNTSDGLSLSQVVDSSSQQITDIIIRLRELAIQNHNGVYTDQDRMNAEQEKNALIQQIDQIAEHTAFNSVKLLDGTYLQTLRTGNLNDETMQVDLHRLNTDSLGGKVVSAKKSELSQLAPTDDYQNLTKIDAFEAETIKIDTNTLSTDFQNFVSSSTSGIYSLSGPDSGDFTVDSSGSIQSNTIITFQDKNIPSNTKIFSVAYTNNNGETKTEQIELNVKSAIPKTSIIRTASSQITSDEALTVTTRAIAYPPGAGNNVLSQALQNYTDLFPAGTFSLEGTDSSIFSITQDGTITGNLSYNNPQDADRDNIYEFDVKYETLSGDSFLETVSLTVTPTSPASTLGAHNPATDEYVDGSEMLIEAIVTKETAPMTFEGMPVSIDLDGGGNNDYTSFGFGSYFQDFVTMHGSGGSFSVQNISADSHVIISDSITINANNVLALSGPRAPNNGLTPDVYQMDLVYTINGKSFNYELFINAIEDNGPSITLLTSDVIPTSSHARFENIQMGFDDLNISILDTPPTQFTMLNQISGMVPNGTLTVSNITAPPSGNIADIQFDGSAFTIDKAAASGTYTADITYSAPGGSVTTSVEFIVTAAPGLPCLNEASASVPAQAGSASDIFRVNSGTQQSTSLRSVRNQLTATEAKKLSFNVYDDPAVISNELKNYATQNPSGEFSLSGIDSEHLTIDQKGLVKLIENADFERKETYEFNINYSTDSGIFTNKISLNITDNLVDNTLHLNDISISTASKAQEAVMVLDKALIQVNEFQAYIGSIQNRLSSSLELTYVNLENALKSRGRIIDADFAAETQIMATQQILMQSAQSVLAQANNAKQNILTLIG